MNPPFEGHSTYRPRSLQRWNQPEDRMPDGGRLLTREGTAKRPEEFCCTIIPSADSEQKAVNFVRWVLSLPSKRKGKEAA
jgi:hypothetical protein